MHTYIPTIIPPNPKFGLIAHMEVARDSVALFLIHTELPTFIASNPALVKGITKITKGDHPFLEYDSWLRFGDVHSCQHSELMRQVGNNDRCFCGYASKPLLQQLVSLIPLCPELSPRWQARYVEALTTAIAAAA